MEKKVYVIHENDEWVLPLRAAFEEQGTPYEEWHLSEGAFSLDSEPPEGVFYNRMSASSHTRGHRYAPEWTASVLSWLEHHGRRVVNNSRALQLEVSKVLQYQALKRQCIPVPKTIAAYGKEQLLEQAKQIDAPFIAKHNRGGKGLGVRLFQDVGEFIAYVKGDDFVDSPDGITLLQEYIEAPEPYITRMEFVGGKFLYAVRVNTSDGFELCPADACTISFDVCPADSNLAKQQTPVESPPKFTIQPEFSLENLEQFELALAEQGIEVAGIEVIQDKDGQFFAYDINTNTNYNSEAEEKAGIFGMKTIASFLRKELDSLS